MQPSDADVTTMASQMESHNSKYKGSKISTYEESGKQVPISSNLSSGTYN